MQHRHPGLHPDINTSQIDPFAPVRYQRFRRRFLRCTLRWGGWVGWFHHYPCHDSLRINSMHALIFDIGNVLVDYDHAQTLAAVAASFGVTPDDLHARIAQSASRLG
jgi:hypothetical protein